MNLHKDCGGEIKKPLRKTATCLKCGQSTRDFEMSSDGNTYFFRFLPQAEADAEQRDHEATRKLVYA